MALSNFIQISDALIEFNAELESELLHQSAIHSLEVHRDELREIWQRVKPKYEASLAELAAADDKRDIETLKARYQTTYRTYVHGIAKISEVIESKRSAAVSPPNPTRLEFSSSPNVNLPPCDTDLFHGDYLSWPSFRDLFTALYINNTRLSPVEKLFHLNSKTRGEAREIVRKAPLTNEGFELAWRALEVRFDNKRLLLNSQLKTLFNLPGITVESSESIKQIQSTINGIIASLKLYSIDIKSWNPIFVYVCSMRLPEITLSLWEQSVKNKSDFPSWTELDSFLTCRFQTLETVRDFGFPSTSQSISNSKNENVGKSMPKNSSSKRVNSYRNGVVIPNCKLCPNENHTIRLCSKFHNMTYADRLTTVKQLKLCLNCFSKGHLVKDCKSAFNCQKCNRRHNTLLHQDCNEEMEIPETDQKSIQSTSNGDSIVPIQSCFAANSKTVLLGTAMVGIRHNGEIFKARALFDSGSEASFLSEHLFNLLKLKARKFMAHISGLNGTLSAKAQKICMLQITSPMTSGFDLEAPIIVIPKLTSSLPTFSVSEEMFSTLPDIHLADPEFYRSSYIDILIGADLIPQVMLNGIINPVCGSLLAQETVFGWILTGPIPKEPISVFRTTVSLPDDIALDELVSKFWELEDLPRVKPISDMDKYCEDMFVETTTRNEAGRYIVTLPFKPEFPSGIQLGQSQKIALSQYIRNENRLLRDIELKRQYDAVLAEYIELGHMKRVRDIDFTPKSNFHYLPHHAVVRPNSVTTKVRVVFNASNPTSNGMSLNDVLHPGPSLQKDLCTLLLQWRFYKVVFNSDIEKMYRQICVHPKHTTFQRILYRKSPYDEIEEFELQTVTFGVNCAPFLALRTIQQQATDVRLQYPLASEILESSMYVDDVLGGSHDILSATKTQKELISALGTAGFLLRKWTSNSKEFLKSIPKDHLLNSEFLEFEDSSKAKTLGVRWNAKLDDFYFVAGQLDANSDPTKRNILSNISKLFDPAGWLCPFIVLAKLLMRDVWLSKVGWDDPLPPNLLAAWHSFLGNYSRIGDIRIPRWIHFTPESDMELHGFCDASEKAYAIAIYVRVAAPSGEIVTHLLMSKSRVAPLKTISIPRLELCGAALLAEAIESILPSIPNCKVFCWTDSTIVLAWLMKPAFQWKTFVANRVSKICEVVPVDHWGHVESRQNPADLASRGVFPDELIQNDLWWFGPLWLRHPSSLWPIKNGLPIDETLLEAKTIHSHFTYFQNYQDPLDRFSSLGRALRVMAYVYRFISNCRASADITSRTHSLTNDEIQDVRDRLIVLSQKLFYPTEYKALSNGEQITSTSSLLTLNPFCDPKGLLRICSRIAHSESLTYNERYPIILPYHGTFSRLLILFIHCITLHGGNSLMLRMLRLQFWIPKAKILIKACVHNCKICVISKHKLRTQLMGTLPPERTTLSRPFTNTGIDFAGPFDIKNYSARSCTITKGYVCLFVCFATRAIHLELTSSLTTSAFLAAFHRFSSRRGCPLKIFSDNGKTFVGASKEVAKNFLQRSRDETLFQFSYQRLSWHFIPPGAPHMGGLWEAGVKSFKAHFRKMAGCHKFTFEEFTTILSRIEACSPLSENPDDLLALTPGHFLTGGPLLSPAEPDESETTISVVNRWRRVVALSQQFSIRWKHEYLKELHKRIKWKRPQPNIQIGSMVVVRDDCLPPQEWKLGRISKIYYGKDDLVRVVDITTQRGTITRPVVKVVFTLTECHLFYPALAVPRQTKIITLAESVHKTTVFISQKEFQHAQGPCGSQFVVASNAVIIHLVTTTARSKTQNPLHNINMLHQSQ
ncbi:uncharacterized protein LOC131996873 [Stomoxys calcitrans]|uniref:uncharacterized protein LOC131996873 n=1 Tax=Stomoxys calcitrans TaxID=35570 RepID=UPI0027E37E45|nr:uncharacterized protein LOC131996873 [Stomoxys calcitrans]